MATRKGRVNPVAKRARVQPSTQRKIHSSERIRERQSTLGVISASDLRTRS
jgi:hypothetical protein